MSAPPAIEVLGLAKHFGEVAAVANLSFSVEAGTTVALLGGNGAGKTTTISMLLGLLRPTAGTIRVLGHLMPQERYRVLGRMNFSSPYVDLPHRLTVVENFTVYGHLYGIDNIKDRVAEVAEQLNLTTLLRRQVGNLSAGQKTRVALAKAVLNEPEVLMLDEPSASLDPDTADRMRSFLEEYQRQYGATILLASHNMAEVERLCDQVLMMKEGHLVDKGSPAELLSRYGRENMEDVFLDIARNRRSGAFSAEVDA